MTLDEARKIAIEHLQPGMGLMEEHTRELPHGWYFLDRSLAYIESRDVMDSIIGGGGFVVGKEDGSVYRFGSAYPVERNLEAYEFGIRYENHDILITAVHNLNTAVNHLYNLGITHVVPEVQYGITWRIPRPYPRSYYQELLQKLPATVSNCGTFFFAYEKLLKLHRGRSMDYKLVKHQVGV